MVKRLRNALFVEENGQQNKYQLVPKSTKKTNPRKNAGKKTARPPKKTTKSTCRAVKMPSFSVRLEKWDAERIAFEQKNLIRTGEIRDIKDGIKTLAGKCCL